MSLSDIIVERFWTEWENRFENNSGNFIVPKSMMVKKASRQVTNVGGEKEVAIKANKWVNSNITYKLSEKWKTPIETLRSKRGDCEDVTFLLASMFPHLGIDESEVVIGTLSVNGKDQFHTWNRVNGKILDGTADPKIISPEMYKERKSYTVKYNKGEKCKDCHD